MDVVGSSPTVLVVRIILTGTLSINDENLINATCIIYDTSDKPPSYI